MGRVSVSLAVTSVATAAIAIGLSPPALAATYAEGSNGDLSGDRSAPTFIALDPGPNTIAATSVAGDVEYFRVSVPPGTRLTLVTLGAYSSATNASFIGVQAGTTFTQPPTGTAVEQLLGWVLFGGGDAAVGTDILDDMGAGYGAIGFVGPLGSGDYTFWAQETAGAPASYTLIFNVAAVPTAVPATGSLAGVALALLLLGIGLAPTMVRRRLVGAGTR